MINSVFFMGKKMVGTWRPNPDFPVAWISLTDPGSSKIDFSWHEGPLLELSFYDVRNEFYDEPSILPGPTATHADAILDFLEVAQRDQAEYLLAVNCHEGSSRSAAVAKFVSDYYQVPSFSPHSFDLTCYNRTLFQHLIEGHTAFNYVIKPDHAT